MNWSEDDIKRLRQDVEETRQINYIMAEKCQYIEGHTAIIKWVLLTHAAITLIRYVSGFISP